MTINPNEDFAGVRLLKIRNLLRDFNRRFGGWGATDVSIYLKIPSKQAEAVVALLAERGYITDEDPCHGWLKGADAFKTLAETKLTRPDESSISQAQQKTGRPEPQKNLRLWYLTSAGVTFASAPATKPISRKTADAKIAKLLERVLKVNDDKTFAFRVSSVAIIGSYLSEKSKIGDVDVHVTLGPRFADRAQQARIECERRDEAIRNGRHFRNYSQELSWPSDEVMLFLKSRSTSLKFVSEAASFLPSCEKRIIFSLGEGDTTKPTCVALDRG